MLHFIGKRIQKGGRIYDFTSSSRFRKTDAFGRDSPSPIWLAKLRCKLALVSRQDSPWLIWMALFRIRMSRFPIENNQDGSPKMRMELRILGGWHKLNMDGRWKIWMALWMRSGFQMLNKDEKWTIMADFSKSAAKYLIWKFSIKSTNNGNFRKWKVHFTKRRTKAQRVWIRSTTNSLSAASKKILNTSRWSAKTKSRVLNRSMNLNALGSNLSSKTKLETTNLILPI
jgi:hypothetical protein